MPVLLALLLLLPSWAYAAIAINGAVTESVATLTSQVSMTTSVVGQPGTDRLMVVCVQSRTSGSSNGAITGITFSGTALTEAISTTYTAGSVFRTSLWYLLAPAVATADVVVTWATTDNDQAQGYSVLQFTGVAQSQPVHATAIGSGNGATASAVVTTTASNTMIVDCALGRSDTGLTVGAGQTAATDRMLNPAGVNDGAGLSTTPKATAGAETMDWTQGVDDWLLVAAAFSESGGASPPSSPSGVASLSWINGTDNVGVTGSTIRRCTGTACTPTVGLTVVGPGVQAYLDRTIVANTTYGYSVNNVDAAGNPSAYTAPTYTTTSAIYRTALADETFARADSTDLGASWDTGYTSTGNFQIVSGGVRPGSTSIDSVETYNALSTPNDQWISLTIPSLDGLGVDTFPSVLVRMANAPTYTGYECKILTDTTVGIWERTAGVPSTLINGPVSAWQANDQIRCEAEGTALRMYRVRAGADELLLSTTDATVTSGKTGIFTWTSVAARYLGAVQIGGFSSTPPVAPTVSTLTLDATGADLTYGATTPTTIRVSSGNNAGTQASVVIEPISAFPAGRYTHTWPNGFEYACFSPRDAQGVENTAPAATKCASLTGIVQPTDTTPLTMLLAAPTGTLNQGTTGTTVLVNLDKSGACRIGLTTGAYAALTDTMPTVGQQASFAVTGLTNGSTTHYYAQCAFTNSFGSLIETSAALDIAITVAAGAPTDSTPPSTLSGLVAVPLGQSQVELTVTAGTDNVAIQGYQFYVDLTGACTGPYTPIITIIPTTTIITNLPSSHAVSFVAKAIDTSQTYSADYSNCVTVTTLPTQDSQPPSEPANLAVAGVYKRSVMLSWTTPVDDLGPAFTIIEACTGIGCANFSTIRSSVVGQSLILDLLPSTHYRFQIAHSDQAGNVTATYSAIVDADTQANGLDRPRLLVPFGHPRLPRN